MLTTFLGLSGSYADFPSSVDQPSPINKRVSCVVLPFAPKGLGDTRLRGDLIKIMKIDAMVAQIRL